ncbi:MAG: sigma-54-dependent Fis family transcriptional regulator [Desulfovibrio sp.]|uniref:sigma-54-dependent transcriptional regulator n=1 Tax=Desulfovibrio sp. TaxID=885 RepID=UPI001A72C998|nr:sigma-54 dependent transcriptional regulator [Desulfovibrio sp.]MBD5417487.1 sigma-54-dependent Fis family transcriptional regulator [Desulfovibrio sp.]
MKKLSILVADDDAAHRRMLVTLLANWGYAVEAAADGAEAVRLGRERPFDLALLDVRMPIMDGLTALKELHEARPALPVLMMTAYSDVPAAVEAIKSGAWDYLAKPLDFERLKVSLRNVFAHADLVEENAALSRQLAEGGGHGGILGQSAPMRELWEMIRTIAPSEATVLVAGESGTGKELAARAVHDLSRRAQGPFVAVNCGALTETLLASELFGHEKGAFTGADRRHEGLFVRARGGTLFLDEIGEMPLAMQVKLLRVLQEREVLSVGGTRPESVDVRVIAATNRDLARETAEGRFREDLYYRLNVVTLTMPPLRDREGDIELLARHFAARFGRANHKRVAGITPQALDILARYAWPGNVRELENVMERAVILMPGEHIDVRELPQRLLPGRPEGAVAADAGTAGEARGAALPESGDGRLPTLEEVEREVILRTVARCGGNKSEAARVLGITRKTLHARLNRYGAEPDAGEEG